MARLQLFRSLLNHLRMNTIVLLLAGLLCVVVVNGRHYEDGNQPDNVEDQQFEARRYRERSGEQRHRRRRWQMGYGYDYQPHSHYPERRNSYDRNEDYVPQIFKLLDDLSDLLKRNQQPSPPPPPQPIYVPYPVPYPVPQYINCKPTTTDRTEDNKNEEKNQTVTGVPPRINVPGPIMEDERQNWGIITNDNMDYEDDGNDGARPISFDPIKPKIILTRPPPEVDHGSSQAEATTRKARVPINSAQSVSKSANPGPCNAAIISCCNIADELKQRECFSSVGCATSAQSGTCSQEAINRAFDSFKLAYSPMN
ncbi:hypothetical protein K1T71_005484 [Dendrolimus kikuchii]|uniref:Uncharacterized protein n=1 Tax=Dendrolimus kikuchii TaxID=765133 RepID=A0ACC1D459_9NEOP|nr:hypothetical protein K1T71_005484 [Dendrolimus kikuchii]